jgi:hypothetical protein
MKEKIPVRVFACGHRRPEAIRHALGDRNYQKIGEYGYCRRCMKDRKIIDIE